MATLSLNSRTFDIDLVVFDKDGTLIDLHHLWGNKAKLWVEGLVEQVNGDDVLRQRLWRTIGYDAQRNRAITHSPLAVSTMPELYTIAATVLYQQGFGWHDAQDIIQKSLATGIGSLPTAELLKPLGDVAALFRRLKQANVQIAIVTSDDRLATLATLELLGVKEQVSILACGDDDRPSKPNPDALWHISNQLAVLPAKIMMVGDSVGDMQFGSNAGVACRVGILGGASEEEELAAHADIILESIEQIRVL